MNQYSLQICEIRSCSTTFQSFCQEMVLNVDNLIQVEIVPYDIHLLHFGLKLSKPSIGLLGNRGVEKPFAIGPTEDRILVRVTVCTTIDV
jgi:hypothetical protein